jgi:hypothetical protein
MGVFCLFCSAFVSFCFVLFFEIGSLYICDTPASALQVLELQVYTLMPGLDVLFIKDCYIILPSLKN